MDFIINTNILLVIQWTGGTRRSQDLAAQSYRHKRYEHSSDFRGRTLTDVRQGGRIHISGMPNPRRA